MKQYLFKFWNTCVYVCVCVCVFPCQPGEEVPSTDPCMHCNCSDKMNPDTGLYTSVCTPKECNKTCEEVRFLSLTHTHTRAHTWERCPLSQRSQIKNGV